MFNMRQITVAMAVFGVFVRVPMVMVMLVIMAMIGAMIVGLLFVPIYFDRNMRSDYAAFHAGLRYDCRLWDASSAKTA